MTRRRRGRPVAKGAAPDPAVETARAHSIFLRGLSLGALVGAAIAGSAVWERRRLRRQPGAAADVPDVTVPAAAAVAEAEGASPKEPGTA